MYYLMKSMPIGLVVGRPLTRALSRINHGSMGPLVQTGQWLGVLSANSEQKNSKERFNVSYGIQLQKIRFEHVYIMTSNLMM